MPIYEYECSKCGHIDEVIQKFSDKPLTKCRRCSGKLHKLVSQSAFHLKGSGWYVTDYANKPSNASAAKSTKNDSNSDSKTSEKPETKSKKSAD